MELPSQALEMGGVGAPEQPDLLVTGVCKVEKAAKYFYGKVNIYDGGSLEFEQPATGDPDIDFWASSIIVEANGALTAGVKAAYGTPRLNDKRGGFLTIHLYGKNDSVGDPAKDPGQGVLCKSHLDDGSPCGIPHKVWQNNGATVLPGCGNNPINKDSECIAGLADTTKDFFYQYGPLYGDGKCTNGKIFDVSKAEAECGGIAAAGKVGYFGYKVLAVSYGGTLMLRGYKGAADGIDKDHLATGNSWMRLSGDVSSGTSLRVDGTPADRWWLPGDGTRDEIVLTTTDYLPGHSELLTLNAADGVQGDQVNFTPAIKWFHSGERSSINLGVAKGRLEAAGMDKNLVSKGAETRAAVALLTRSIRIVSEGDAVDETYAEALKKNPDYSFGGHTIFRQGFKQVKIQGVEFVNLGQGGKLGHYPVHFHMARQVPAGTIVEDSAVNQSNTRWFVLHDTQGVTFQRNVGWKSIGHGFYLENGTEADNNFYSNIGIFARAAIANAQNPRHIPGILADNQDPASFTKENPKNVANPGFVYRSDNEYPTVFWISNGWNNFQGNMAAGAGACGVAYWFVPMENTDMPDVPTAKNQYVEPGGPNDAPPPIKTKHMKWADAGVKEGKVHFGYAGLQRLPLWAGSTPLESFYKNYATSTMMSFQTTADAPACDGFVAADEAKDNPPNVPFVAEVASFAPKPKRAEKPNEAPATQPDLVNDKFYPHAIGKRAGTRCAVSADGPDCTPPEPGHPGLTTPCTDGTPFLAAGHNPDTPNNPMFACAPTVIDHFTSSFHWAQGDVSAIWLRPQWYLVTNSVLTDVQQGGITFVTGGDVLRASIITGYWGLLRDSLLIGHTQPQDAAHKFTLDIGPFNLHTAEKCAKPTSSKLPSYCLNKAEGVSLPLTGFFNNQRMENIYDGPSYRDSTAYLDVSTAGCAVGDFNTAIDKCIYGTKQTAGVLKDETANAKNPCYVPNAAIAWKQPNGFFYPPAFHAENLYFGNVDIRHFVIDPLFEPFKGATPETGAFGQAGSYLTDAAAVGSVYCVAPQVNPKTYFNDFTSIDRQTELNDDDGALTGLSNNIQATLDPPNPLKQTISVNEDDYFTAPVETPECASNIGKNNEPANACKSPSKKAPTVTAKTSPYDYVSTVIFHTTFGDKWDADCTNPKCYGVPLYRQFLAGDQDKDDPTHKNATREWKHWYQNKCDKDQTTLECRWPFIRMAGTAINTRETLTVNNGTYYLDTTVPFTIQKTEPYNTQNGGASTTSSVNVFQPDTQINPNLKFIGTYNVFFVYAKPSTRQTYQIYLGKDATAADIKAIRVKLIDLTLDHEFGAKQPWLDVDTSRVKDKGIVSVTVDFSKLTDDSLKVIPKNGLCQPLTFCKPSGETCGSAVSDDDPLVKANKDFKAQTAGVCKEWAVKDLDCPPKGCYGFSFTIPKEGFKADATLTNPSPHRPPPEPFPTDKKDQGEPAWPVKFLRTTIEPDQSKGQCHYTELPGTGNCTVPDWVPQ
ncbi:MAG TPA: hypothetical protein VGF34_03970 [Stellaceae bacterium]